MGKLVWLLLAVVARRMTLRFQASLFRSRGFLDLRYFISQIAITCFPAKVLPPVFPCVKA